MASTFLVSLPAQQAMDVVYEAVMNSVTGEVIDCYEIAPAAGGKCIVACLKNISSVRETG